jgi:hypothetical protein
MMASRLFRETKRCVLCEKPSYLLGVSMPEVDRDCPRVLAYGLCVKCSRTRGVRERVEEKFKAYFNRG